MNWQGLWRTRSLHKGNRWRIRNWMLHQHWPIHNPLQSFRASCYSSEFWQCWVKGWSQIINFGAHRPSYWGWCTGPCVQPSSGPLWSLAGSVLLCFVHAVQLWRDGAPQVLLHPSTFVGGSDVRTAEHPHCRGGRVWQLGWTFLQYFNLFCTKCREKIAVGVGEWSRWMNPLFWLAPCKAARWQKVRSISCWAVCFKWEQHNTTWQWSVSVPNLGTQCSIKWPDRYLQTLTERSHQPVSLDSRGNWGRARV